MLELKAHPNTRAVIDAWRSLGSGKPAASGASAEDYPGLVGRLFVLHRLSNVDFCFRRVGATIDQLFGRVLADHNFLSLWKEPDLSLVSAALEAARADRGPALIQARGESLDGKRLNLEFALAPLLAGAEPPSRFLGLCQSLSPERALGGRPVRSMKVVSLYPPAPAPDYASIRLVSSR
ncbi:MAG: PAS domain-containing protein [Alphaproteobacteria bacterium]|nr:PAS domain-containing protein [Alphaproteobacteria bacterium]